MNFRNKIKNFSRKLLRANGHTPKKGFSLVELIVAIAVFFFVMTMLMGTFSSFMKNYSNSKKVQRDIENAQYAMNSIAKTLRTSKMESEGAVSSFPLDVYDYSRGECLRYAFDNSTIKYYSSVPTTSGDPTTCVYGSGSLNNLTANNIIGASISATPTAVPNFGKITIALSVKSGTTAAIPIQMSVSLRQ